MTRLYTKLFSFEDGTDDYWDYKYKCLLDVNLELIKEMDNNHTGKTWPVKKQKSKIPGSKLYISPLAQFTHDHLTNLSDKFGYKTRYHASGESVEFSVYSETLWELNNYMTYIERKSIVTKSFGLFHILKLLRQSFLNYKQFEISEYDYPDKLESPLSRHLSMANEIISYNRGWLYVWLLLLVIVFDIILFTN